MCECAAAAVTSHSDEGGAVPASAQQPVAIVANHFSVGHLGGHFLVHKHLKRILQRLLEEGVAGKLPRDGLFGLCVQLQQLVHKRGVAGVLLHPTGDEGLPLPHNGQALEEERKGGETRQ